MLAVCLLFDGERVHRERTRARAIERARVDACFLMVKAQPTRIRMAALVMTLAWLHAPSVAIPGEGALPCAMRMGLRGGRGGVARRGWDEGEVVEAAWHPTPPPCEAASLHAGAEGAAECMGCGAWDAGGSVDPQDGLFYCSACWDGVDSGLFARRWLCAGDRTPLEDGGADGRAGELRVVSYNILGEYHALRTPLS